MSSSHDATDEMRYKTKHSETDRYIIYRKFHYTPRQLGIRGFLATFFASVAIFILIPLPDEFIIIPAFSKLVMLFVDVNLKTAAIYAYVIYKVLGVLSLTTSIVFGAEYLRDAFFSKVRDVQKMQKELENNGKELQSKVKQALKTNF